jgi:CO/xanthine dehydrogenase FAD-binding subunit
MEELLGLLAEHGGHGRILAGGQSLLPSMKAGLAEPAALIDINAVKQLSYIREENGMLRIGALARQREVETSDLVQTHSPLLAMAVSSIGSLAVRNRGTIAGSLAHADPRAELPVAAIALNAEIAVVDAKGEERTIKASDFFIDRHRTALEPGQMVLEIRVPKPAQDTGWAFLKMEHRPGEFGHATVAVVVRSRADGTLTECHLVQGGLAARPMRLAASEAVLKNELPDEAVLRRVGEAARAGVAADDDALLPLEFRQHLAAVLARRGVAMAAARATAEKQ